MHDLTFEEIDAVSGGVGHVAIAVAAVVVVAAVAFGVGVYNGYQDARLDAKVKSSAR